MAISKLIVTLIMLATTFNTLGQDSSLNNLKDFKLIIQKTNTGLNMHSIEGTAWKELSFNLINNQSQAIDEHGMTKKNKVSSEKNPELANFLFTITKTSKGVELKGIDGTAWESLGMTLINGEKAMLDQFGIKTIQ